jgi:hypothetical protein
MFVRYSTKIATVVPSIRETRIFKTRRSTNYPDLKEKVIGMFWAVEFIAFFTPSSCEAPGLSERISEVNRMDIKIKKSRHRVHPLIRGARYENEWTVAGIFQGERVFSEWFLCFLSCLVDFDVCLFQT